MSVSLYLSSVVSFVVVLLLIGYGGSMVKNVNDVEREHRTAYHGSELIVGVMLLLSAMTMSGMFALLAGASVLAKLSGKEI